MAEEAIMKIGALALATLTGPGRTVRSAQFPRSLWILYTGIFLNRFGSFVIVFLVLYMASRGYTAAQAGIAVGSYGVGNLGAALCGGYLTDGLGRRSTIVLSMLSSALTMLALSQAQTLPLIILLTGVAGITSELYRPAASALLTDLVPSEQRVTAFAWYRLAVNLGFVAGPVVAGLLASRSFLLLFVGDALTSLVFGLLALVALPETKRGSAGQEREQKEEGLWGALRRDSRYLLFLLGSILIACISFQQLSTFALQVRSDGFPSAVYGLLLSVNGILIVLFELPISGVTRRLPTRPVIAAGWLLIALGLSVTAAAHTVGLLALTVVLWTLGEMMEAPVSAAYVASLAPTHLRGRYQGAFGMTYGVGQMVGPAVGMALFSWNPVGLWVVCGTVGIIAAALLLVSGRLPASVSKNAHGHDTPPSRLEEKHVRSE
jgi:MFS family permease